MPVIVPSSMRTLSVCRSRCTRPSSGNEPGSASAPTASTRSSTATLRRSAARSVSCTAHPSSPMVKVSTMNTPHGRRSGAGRGPAMPDLAATHSIIASTTAREGLSSDRPGMTRCAETVQPSTAITCGYSGTGTPRPELVEGGKQHCVPIGNGIVGEPFEHDGRAVGCGREPRTLGLATRGTSTDLEAPLAQPLPRFHHRAVTSNTSRSWQNRGGSRADFVAVPSRIG